MRGDQSPSLARPLTDEELELIEALLGAARSGAGRFLGQIEDAEVVGRCVCGCPSIDLAVKKASRDGRPVPLVMADAESPEGMPVSVILWVSNGRLSGLEVHTWDGERRVRLPRPDTLQNIRTRTG